MEIEVKIRKRRWLLEYGVASGRELRVHVAGEPSLE